MKSSKSRVELGRLLQSPLTDEEWEFVNRHGNFRADPRAEDLTRAARLVADLRQLVNRQPLDVSEQHTDKELNRIGAHGESLLPAVEAQRAQMYSEQVAQAARLHADVIEFRRTCLSDCFLDEKDARALLRSYAALKFPCEYFTSRGAPLIGHKSQFVPDQPWLISKGKHDHSFPGTVTITWENGEIVEAIENHFVSLVPRLPLAPLEIELPNEDSWVVQVWPNSVLDELRIASIKLSSEYPWSRGQAAWFMVTNQTPLIWPIRLLSRERKLSGPLAFERITLSIDPWLSARSVAEIYRGLQGSARTPSAPRISDRNLRVYQFVCRQRGIRGEPLTWSTLMELWNKSSDGKAEPYRDWRPMCRDFRRAELALGVTEPGAKPSLKSKPVKRRTTK